MARPTKVLGEARGSWLGRQFALIRRSTRGVGPVTVGVLIAGGCTYGFLGVTARAIGPEEFNAVSALWALVFTAGPGLFLPLQQELGRSLAARVADSSGASDVFRHGLLPVVFLVIGAIVATLLAGPLLVDHVLGGSWLLFLALEISIVSFATSFVARGLLSGLGQFVGFARVVAGEAAVRLVLAVVLAVAGVDDAGPYCLAIALSPFVSVAALWSWRRPPSIPPGPPISRRSLARALSYLLAGSLCAQGLANAGPIVVEIMAIDGQGAEAGRFLAALMIARLALYLFQAVQAALVPNLAAMAKSGHLDEFKAAVRNLVRVIGALTVVGSIGGAVLGPTVVEVMFGDGYPVGARTMAFLTGASMLYVLALAVSGALIALEGHRWNSGIWASALAAFAIGLLASDELFLRVEIAYLAGSAVAAALQLVVVVRTARRWTRGPDQHGSVEPRTHA
ncbi:MAG: hypothetical protein U5K30_12655 [Acidimicrobiales bacterium]|nr:hypothetical protein [Acidimicrobiales bacterium]